MTTAIPTWADIDAMVDDDPIELRDLAWSLARRLDAAEAATRHAQAIVASWPHHYEPADAYYSCAQAVDPDPAPGEDDGPGSGCADEDRAGGPCDCGLDQRRAAILEALTGLYTKEGAP